MEDRHGRHGSDAVASELRELVARAAVDVYESVHVSDAETLDGGLRVLLPLGAEAGLMG